MTEPSYKVGARGYMIGILQQNLGVTVDKVFGRETRNAIVELQRKRMMQETGEATKNVFAALKMAWPLWFDRCLTVVDAFEGTGFGGVNKRDIDGAGVTLGIVGFTTEHNEVQPLVRRYVSMKPQVLNNIPAKMRDRLMALCNSQSPNVDAWNDWFYGSDGIVDSWIRDIVAEWGRDPDFQGLQLERVINRYWNPACDACAALGIKSLRGHGLMFDTFVQNGGWRSEHGRRYQQQSQDGSEGGRLRAMAHAVAESANPKWKNDVLSRKMTYAMGFGKVHGSSYDLINYAFEPLEVRT